MSLKTRLEYRTIFDDTQDIFTRFHSIVLSRDTYTMIIDFQRMTTQRSRAIFSEVNLELNQTSVMRILGFFSKTAISASDNYLQERTIMILYYNIDQNLS